MMTTKKRMPGFLRYYYDTEFEENGDTIMLISIGIVCEDGREYYAVNADMDQDRVRANDWLMRNVWPSLPTIDVEERTMSGDTHIQYSQIDTFDQCVKLKKVIAQEVSDFLKPWGEDRFRGHAELHAWFGSYDHVVLSQLWGRMIDHPGHVPMFTNDLRQLQRDLGDPNLKPQPSGAHNALEDARFNVERHKQLEKIAWSRG